MIDVINLRDKLGLFSELWSPRIVAQMNETQFKVVKIQGEFVWHSHPETDELFLVLAGSMKILLRESELTLQTGEMVVIPKGIEHKPVAEQECHVLLAEPAGTVNTGDAGGEKTAANDVWI